LISFTASAGAAAANHPIFDLQTSRGNQVHSAREIILSEISAFGTISFARFMEIALYHPVHGYYSTGSNIGKSGDFYTSVTVGNIFARILYSQFEEVWTALGQPRRFPLVEFGAHSGLFASDILQHAAENATPFSQSLEYHIVENQPKLQETQANVLRNWPHQIHTYWEELSQFEGLVFANELLDAFPFHLIEWTGSRWLERRVQANRGNLEFTTAEIVDPFLESMIRSVPLPLPIGYVTEICPLRQLWLKRICRQITRGVILLIDYGYLREEFFAPHHLSGTFACYHRHHRSSKPLEQIGQQDITSHVEFSSLIETATGECGFSLLGFTDQHHFLTAASAPWLRSLINNPLTHSLQSDLRRLQTLLHPALMGSQFRVLAFGRGLSRSILSGFGYQQLHTGAEFLE
jgi:SAM-dependent MidA family methyltransferase